MAELRAWVRALHDAGYVVDQFGTRRRRHRPLRAARAAARSSGAAASRRCSATRWWPARSRSTAPTSRSRRSCPRIANGEHIWTQLFSEPDAGSDLTSLKHARRARRRPLRRERAEGVEHVGAVRRLRLPARPDRAGTRARRASPRSSSTCAAPGVTTRPLREITGTTDFNEVFLDDVAVPVANMIGAPGEGWRVAGASLAQERGGVGAGRQRGSDRAAC